jgi:L-ribulose-5-phosphate 3-epimerase
MKIGIRLHDAAGRDIAQKMINAKAQGFECIHLALSKVMGEEYILPESLTQELARHIKDITAPMDIAVLGCYLNLADPDAKAAKQIQEKYIAHLRFSKWAGALLVGTETYCHNSRYPDDPLRRRSDETLELFIERLTPVVHAAEAMDAVIAIEPVWNHIVCNAQRARMVLDHFRSSCLKIIFDPVNLLSTNMLEHHEEIFDDALELLYDDTAVIHIKDCVPENGSLRATAAGEGIINYAPLFERLRELSCTLPLTLENTHPHNAEKALRHVRMLTKGEPDE